MPRPALLAIVFLSQLAVVMGSAAYARDNVAGSAARSEPADRTLLRISTESLLQVAQAEPSEREIVRWVQQVLAELGYDPGPIDGALGSRTRDAIRRYEKDNGLTVTGGISESLLDDLEASIQASSGGLLAPERLDELVESIALYPDELLAIVLPASTFPIDVVQAARFLEEKKRNPDLQPNRKWDTSVLGLLNYPEVVQMMSADLDWTQQLGDAVVNQQDDVMEAVQRFRARTYAAGNLEGDDKQVVIHEKEIIRIESADPEVIYVPYYQPSTVVVRYYTPTPVVYYYPTPYPLYYSPAATFYSGVFVGVVVGYGFSWHHHRIHMDHDVHRHGGRPRGGAAWQSHRAPGAPGRAGPPARPGQTAARPGSRPGGVATTRPGATGPGTRPGTSAGSRQRKSAGTAPALRSGGQTATRSATRPGTRQGGQTTFGNANRGRNAYQDSRRGAQSRSGTRGRSGSPGAGRSSRSGSGTFSGHSGGGNRARASSSRGASSRQRSGRR